MKIRLLLFSLMILTASVAFAKPPDPGCRTDNRKTDVAGGVINSSTKKPIYKVSVTAYDASKKERTVLTDGSGNYSFADLKPGTYRLVFEKDGYKKMIREKLVLRGDDCLQLNVELDEEEEFHLIPGQLLISDF